MKIAVAFKIVPDDQDITVSSDGSLDYSKAHQSVSTYDLNALEAAAQLAAIEGDSTIVAISVAEADADSKLKKSVLARGIDEVFIVAGSFCKSIDAFTTAAELAGAIAKTGPFDIIICGDGSADVYAQQVEVQLAARLDLPCVTSVLRMECVGDALLCDRLLESQIETVEVPLPAVVSVVPDGYLPRICGMKDILAAGKKPSSVGEAEGTSAPAIEVVEEKAPEQAARSLEIFDFSVDGDLEKFVAAFKAVL